MQFRKRPRQLVVKTFQIQLAPAQGGIFKVVRWHVARMSPLLKLVALISRSLDAVTRSVDRFKLRLTDSSLLGLFTK